MKSTSTSRFQRLAIGLALLGFAATGFAAQSFTNQFDFARTTGDRDWNFGERQPANTFDNNTSALNFQVVTSPELALSVNTVGAPRLLLNDPNPDVLDASAPANTGDLVAVTNVIARTRFSQLTSSTSGESASVGFVFGVTGSGASQNGFIARIDRNAGANTGKLYIDTLVNGARGANIITSASFTFGGQAVIWFLDLRITSDGATTNVILNAFTDAQIPGTGLGTNRFTDTAFDSVTPTKSITNSLTAYTPGFLGLYFEDNSAGAPSNPSAGLARFYGWYARSIVPSSPAISIAASTPVALEGGAPGAFTLTRSANTSGALTVNYTVSGTATSGVDYGALSGSVNFTDGQTTQVISVTASNDATAEPLETVVLTVNASAAYAISGSATGTLFIADANTPEFRVTAVDTNAYERVALLNASFTVGRPLGSTNTSVSVNFTLGGSAVPGLDYVSSATNTLEFAPGISSLPLVITPIDNALLDGDRTVTFTLQNGAGYALSGTTNAAATIVDDELPAENLLFSDTFETTDSATNYQVLEVAADGVPDSVVDYSFDYSSIGVPPPPGSATTKGLKLSANKVGAAKAAAVNLFPINVIGTNNYALRFNFYIQWDPANNFSEHALAGINHSGSVTNWRNQSPALIAGDGQYAGLVNNEGDNPGTMTLYTSENSATAPVQRDNRGHAAVAAILNSPPFGANGTPTNGMLGCSVTSTNKTWVDCELSQIQGVVRFKVNRVTVMTYTNTSTFTNGHVMLGYMDDFDSTGPANNFAIYDNVRVVQLPVAPQITAQPQDRTNTVGTTATFTIATTGDSLGYQWYFGSTPLAGKTSATLTLPDVQLADAGSYHVVITNAINSVTSQAALLSVNRPPSAANTTYARSPGVSLKIKLSDLLGLCSDADGDPVLFQGVDSGTNSASVTTNANYIYYSTTNESNDALIYTVRDNRGGSASASILIHLSSGAGGLAQNLTPIDGTVAVQFAAIPGYRYDIERALDVNFTIGLTVLVTTNAPGNGQFGFIDTDPPQPTAFYRLKYNP